VKRINFNQEIPKKEGWNPRRGLKRNLIVGEHKFSSQKDVHERTVKKRRQKVGIIDERPGKLKEDLKKGATVRHRTVYFHRENGSIFPKSHSR